MNNELAKVFSRAAELCGDGADVVMPNTKVESDEDFLQRIILEASNGEVSSIFKLKKLAKENLQAKNALEKLYYDGQNKNAVGTLILRDGLKYIEKCEFAGCENITRIILPDSVVGINAEAFKGCTCLTEIKFPKGLTSIGDEAFCGCTALTEINFPKDLTEIGKVSFAHCKALEKINLPNGLTSIGNWAFDGCTSLTEINLPDSLTKIGNNAFKNCNNIRVTCSENTKRRFKDIYCFRDVTWNIVK